MTPAPFRLTHPTLYEQERDLQASCCQALDSLLLLPAFWFSAAIGAVKLSPQQAAALARAGVKRGIPDILVIAPLPREGSLIIGIELKTRTGRLSKTKVVRTRSGAPRILEGQEDVFLRLQAAGMIIELARSVPDMLDALERWHVPLRSHYR